MPQRDRPLRGDRHAERPEDLGDERDDGLRRAQDHRDLLGSKALVADEAGRLGGDELQLGALPAALQQRHGAAGVDGVGIEQRVGRVLEQAALEVVQGVPGAGRVVLGAGLEHDVVVDPARAQLLEGRRPGAEGRAPGS